MEKKIINLNEKQIQIKSFAKEFLTLCKKYNLGVFPEEIHDNLEVCKINDWEKYSNTILNDFKCV